MGLMPLFLLPIIFLSCYRTKVGSIKEIIEGLKIPIRLFFPVFDYWHENDCGSFVYEISVLHILSLVLESMGVVVFPDAGPVPGDTAAEHVSLSWAVRCGATKPLKREPYPLQRKLPWTSPRGRGQKVPRRSDVAIAPSELYLLIFDIFGTRSVSISFLF